MAVAGAKGIVAFGVSTVSCGVGVVAGNEVARGTGAAVGCGVGVVAGNEVARGTGVIVGCGVGVVAGNEVAGCTGVAVGCGVGVVAGNEVAGGTGVAIGRAAAVTDSVGASIVSSGVTPSDVVSEQDRVRANPRVAKSTAIAFF
jgi:hypothetical protein